jgi:hypothetical protein
MSAERNFVLRLGSSTSSEPHFRPQDGGGGARRVEIDVRRARNVVGPSVALVGVAVTIAIYGVVGVIVKMDDVDLRLWKLGGTAAGSGRAIVRGMPVLLITALSFVGIVAGTIAAAAVYLKPSGKR